MRRVRDAVLVHERQASLLAVGIGQPAKEMIEAAVLHGYHDDVLDPRVFRIGQRL